MPIVATDLVLYAAASMPDTDAGVSGGAIDNLRYMDYTQLAANDDIEVVSSAAGDTTQTVTVEARNAAGQIVSQTVTLTGVTAVVLTTMGVVERVLKAELSATCAGIVTVRRSPAAGDLRAIPIGKRGFMAMFRKAASDPSVVKNYYTKGFWKNEHATLALTTASITQDADPDARITHLLAAAVNDVATTTTRLTAPAIADTQDPDTFDDTSKSVPGADLAAAAAIGVWFRLQLTAADTPHRATYTSAISGSSV